MARRTSQLALRQGSRGKLRWFGSSILLLLALLTCCSRDDDPRAAATQPTQGEASMSEPSNTPSETPTSKGEHLVGGEMAREMLGLPTIVHRDGNPFSQLNTVARLCAMM